MNTAAKPTRATSIRTPGTPDPAADAAEQDEAAIAGAPDIEDPKPAATAPDIQSMINAAVEKQLAQRLAQAGVLSETVPAAALPDQSSVDVDKIDRMVLTKQGYVVPKDYGTPKGAAAVKH